jgi:hypothetical protein
MDEWLNGWVDGWQKEWMIGWMDEYVSEWMDRWVKERKKERMNGWVYEWKSIKHRLVVGYIYLLIISPRDFGIISWPSSGSSKVFLCAAYASNFVADILHRLLKL